VSAVPAIMRVAAQQCGVCGCLIYVIANGCCPAKQIGPPWMVERAADLCERTSFSSTKTTPAPSRGGTEPPPSYNPGKDTGREANYVEWLRQDTYTRHTLTHTHTDDEQNHRPKTHNRANSTSATDPPTHPPKQDQTKAAPRSPLSTLSIITYRAAEFGGDVTAQPVVPQVPRVQRRQVRHRRHTPRHQRLSCCECGCGGLILIAKD
jgi:hypothetical protein